MDLAFLLLITFVITFPLIEHGIEVNLPKMTTEPVDAQKTRTISLTADGGLFLDGAPVDREALRSEMERFAAVSEKHAVLVRADSDLKYARVVEVLQLLYNARVRRMALVTEGENR
jgi:biopolymer transport protein ExbD